jgi:Cu/Ag efflux pump CusA
MRWTFVTNGTTAMIRLRYATAALLALALLAAGWVGGYFLFRSLSRGWTTPGRDDPPAVLEVVAIYPGASAEEVERQVTIPLEVTFAGMPRLQSLRTRSSFGLSALYVRFEPGTDYNAARQEVINRLATISQPLPAGVTPQLSPLGRDSLRYLLIGPRDAQGRPIYTTHDLRALQDWALEREFRRVPGVIDAVTAGGTVACYEIQPDPDRLRRYGITLQQLTNAIDRGNNNVGGDFIQGEVAMNVRGVGLIGGGHDPVERVLGMKGPQKAAGHLRTEERRRLREIRALVVATVNNRPILIDDLVEGGRLPAGEDESKQGVVVSSQTRTGWVACSGPGAFADEDTVGAIVLLRPGEDPQFLDRVQDRIRELNATGDRLLPGVRIETYHTTTRGEGALWLYGTLPVNISLEAAVDRARKVRELLGQLPEVDRVVSEVGGSPEEARPQAVNEMQFFVGLKAAAEGRDRPRSRTEMIEEIDRLLQQVPGISWLITAKCPEELEAVFPGVLAEDLLEVRGPDLDELERLGGKVQAALRALPGVEGVAACSCLGLPRLDLRVDPDKCRRWGVNSADVSAILQMALAGKGISRMVEGEKTFDIIVRWSRRLRDGEQAILDVPLDILNNQIVVPDPNNPIVAPPRLRLRDLVSPAGKDGEPDPNKDFVRSGAAAIYRTNGKRVLPVRFSVRGRPLADIRAEVEKQVAPLLQAPYRLEWCD